MTERAKPAGDRASASEPGADGSGAQPQGVQGVDPVRLGEWLKDNVPESSGQVTVTPLSGGSSNLTFTVVDGEHQWVLRRPPLSHVLATANDVVREHRVQFGLQSTDVPVPRMVAVCEDESVIGAPFYVMQKLDGIVYDDVDAVAHLDEAQSRAAGFELIDVLARLHAVDAESVGLGDLGRPAGFVERQVNRWRTQWEKSRLRDIPSVDAVLDRLAANLPASERHGIVHGDYSFNNTMWSRTEPARMQGVLDWEMSTLGDPRTDLGMVLVYWEQAGELMWRSRKPQPHRANAGFPTAAELVERYEATSGMPVDHLPFFRALATVKLAVISMGNVARFAEKDPDRAATAVDNVIAPLAGMALDEAARI